MEGKTDYYLYFDGKQQGSFVATACALYSDAKAIKPVVTKIETYDSFGDNQFTIVLNALKTAIDCLIESQIKGSVLLMHQNGTVIKWLLEGKCKDTYRELFSEIRTNMSNLQFDCKFYLKPIAPGENKAKGLCNKVKAPKHSTSGMTRLTFDSNDEEFDSGNDCNIIQFRNFG